MNVEFIDTSILVYAYGDDPAKRKIASALMARLDSRQNGAMSTQNLVEFCSIVTRKLDLSVDTAVKVLETVRGWQIFRPGLDDVTASLLLQRRYSLSFWDAMIVNSAIASGASVLWTEDLNDGKRFGNLVVRNPFTAESVA